MWDLKLYFVSLLQRTYSRKNCELECESDLIYQACGCVLYYMPRMGNDTTICNRDDYDCYKTVKQAIDLTQNDSYSCSCMPGCFELSYGSEVSLSRLGTEKFYTKENIAKTFGDAFSQ